MDHFDYRNGQLYGEDVSLADLAKQVATPSYIYSRATLERHYRVFDQALEGLPHLVCYAVKANSNIAVLNVLARLGSGFDIVSGGELERVIRAGGDPGKTVFSGVGKTVVEMRAALQAGVKCFNVESAPELETLAGVAADMGMTAPVSLRVNPDVDAKTHPYISTGLKENKFGIPVDEAMQLYDQASLNYPSIELVGIDCHIGSQLTEVAPFIEALDRVLDIVGRLRDKGIVLNHIDIGGGLGIRYQDEEPPLPDEYAEAVKERLVERDMTDLMLMLEPGRAIAGNAGILLTRVLYLKQTPDHRFAIVDAAMNDLLRPALYDAWQEVIPVVPHTDMPEHDWDIVGPVCESADTLARNRSMALQQGDLLAIRSSGAYGFVMSSNYNTRGRAVEVMLDEDRFHVVRRRETYDDMMHHESLVSES